MDDSPSQQHFDSNNNNNNNNNNNKDNGGDKHKLEKAMYHCQELLHQYSDEIEPLLSSAELRLMDAGEHSFENMNSTVRNHIKEWRNVVGIVQNQALQSRNTCNRLYVTNKTLEGDLDEKDQVIKSLQEEIEQVKHNYEEQLKGMESLLAVQGSNLSSSSNNNTNNNNTFTNEELERVRKDLQESLRKYQQQQIEHQKLQKSLQIMRLEDMSDLQQDLLNANEQLAKKEDELLRLRWTVEDLELDRYMLENELKRIKNNPSFTSASLNTSSQEYSVDLSKFVEEDNETKTEANVVSKSDISSSMSDNEDTGISPMIMQKMQQALEAAKKMKNGTKSTNFNNTTNNKNTSKEKQKDMQKKTQAKNKKQNEENFDELDEFLQTPMPEDASSLREQLKIGKGIIEQMRNDMEDMKLRLEQAGTYDPEFGGDQESDDDNKNAEDMEAEKERVLAKKKSKHDRFFSTFNILSKDIEDNADLMVQQIGQFDTLVSYAENEKTYRLVMDSLRLKLRAGQTHCSTLTELVEEMINEMNGEDGLDIDDDDETLVKYWSQPKKNGIPIETASTPGKKKNKSSKKESGLDQLRLASIKQMLEMAKKVAETVDEVIDELKGAEAYVHPDQKRVELLQLKYKELQNSMPHITSEKLAALGTLPKFIKKELSKFDRRQKDKKNPALKEKVEKEEEKERALENQRFKSFQSTLDGLMTTTDTVREKANYVNGDLLEMLDNIVVGDEGQKQLQTNTLNEIKAAMKTIEKSMEDIVEEFQSAREYVHPTQESLVAAAMQNVEKSIEIERLKGQLQITKGELEAAQEELKAKQVKNAATLKAPATEEKSTKQHRQVSWGYESMDLAFLKEYGADIQQLTNDDPNEIDDADSKAAKEFLPKLDEKLMSVREHSTNIHNLLTESGMLDGTGGRMYNDVREVITNIDTEVTSVLDFVNEMKESILQARDMIGPDTRYIAKLEQRYAQMKGLYKFKSREVETMKDNLHHREQQLESCRAQIVELELRIQQIMTSANSDPSMRLEAVDTLGVKTQTYSRMMKFIEEAVQKTKTLCDNIVSHVDKDIAQITKEQLDGESRQQMKKLSASINENCEWISKVAQNIEDELIGAKEFVHPDRFYVETLEREILDLKERVNSHMNRDPPEVRGGDDYEDPIMDETKLTPTYITEEDDKRESNRLISQQPLDNSENLKRRISMDTIRAMLHEHEKRTSHIEHADPMQKEVQRRKRASERRHSSLNGVDMQDFKAEANKMKDELREVKSDVPYRTNQPPTEQDIAGLTNLQLPNSIARKRPLEETPANSPTAEAQTQGSPTSWKEAEKVTSIPIVTVPSKDVEGIDEERDDTPGNTKDIPTTMTMEELQSRYENKAKLVKDLQRHITALRQSRQTDIKTLQDALNRMRERCRQWWGKLLHRYHHLESEFQQRLGDISKTGNPSEVEHFKRELATARGELEIWKDKFGGNNDKSGHNPPDISQKLQDLIKECDELRKKEEQSRQSVLKHKQKKRKLKEELKEVQKNGPQSSTINSKEWIIMKEQFEGRIKTLEDNKVEYIQRTLTEMNNLRDYIKQLQKQIQVKGIAGSTATQGTAKAGGFMSFFG